MASSSISSIHRSFKYDVFLSFRGEDTRKNFVDHLYHALQHKSIETYKDDEKIKKGNRINGELLRSIEDSKFYIIVFSKNYASSSWCLDELVKIMDCQKTTEHTAYPIFYDVEPTEVRNQSGAVGQAFAKHEKKAAAGKWRNALEEAAGLAGWELKHTVNGHEAKFIQKVVDQLSLELRSINFNIDENLVGMETRVEDVVSSLGSGFDDVHLIGIKGMGGGGKTTLARAVFDKISWQFEGKSFVENVREVSKDSSSGLKSLQKQILSDVLNDKDINISGVHDGKNLMQRMMRDRKVLVVLDDVDGRDQLEALAGKPSWYKTGSRVIITTRDEQVLIAHNVKLIHDVILLSDTEAICLFSRYAFGREIPMQGYEELSGRVVRYANGLPLTITVLGSFLCGKDEFEWRDALDRLKTIPLNETLMKLELSYTGLEKDYQEIFLDVACILKGWRKTHAIEALESCGFHARNGLRVLEQKSLITISTSHGEEVLSMHDHIEEMGRNIVRRLYPDKPNQHSRLWVDREIEDILSNNSGTEATRSILFYKLRVDPQVVMKGLRKMKELRFLCVLQDDGSYSTLTEFSPYFPNALRFLCWSFYPFRSLPKTFQATNLVALEMSHSKIIQLWEGEETKVLNTLKFLNLSGSMVSTLDLGLTPNLETLNLDECRYLVELHMPVVCLKLRSFNMSYSKLRTLDLEMTPSLEHLDIEQCYDMLELIIPDRCLNLRYLELSYSGFKNIHIGLTPNLKSLNLKYSSGLEELQMSGEYPKLIYFNLSYSALRTLDFGTAPNLEHLHIEDCHNLEDLNMSGELRTLRYLKFWGLKSLRSFHLGTVLNLEYLHIEDCHNLEELHMSGELRKLRYLNFTWLESLRALHLGLSQNLKHLELSHLMWTTLDLKTVLNLEHFHIEDCHNLKELHMPTELGELRYLKLRGFKTLWAFEFRWSKNLKHLELSDHSMLGILNLEHFLDLEHLHIEDCHNLEELHMPLELEELRYLKLWGLESLRTLHHLALSQQLKHLNLGHLMLKTLDLATVEDLGHFHIEDCHDLEEIQMPPELEKLRYLKLWGLESLRTIHLRRYNHVIHLELGYLVLRKLDGLNISDIQHLHIEECHNLKEINFNNEFRNLRYLKFWGFLSLRMHHLGMYQNLKRLEVGHLVSRKLDFENIQNIEHLHIENCHNLEEIHLPGELRKLHTLNFWGLVSLRTLHLRLSPNLAHVKLSLLMWRTLDLETVPDVESLHIEDRKDYVEIHMPGKFRKLRYLTMLESLMTLDLGLSPSLKHLKLSHLMWKTLDLGTVPNLEHLHIEDCHNLEELRMPGELQKLQYLHFTRLDSLKTLEPWLPPNLEELIIDECDNLVELHMSGRCLNLKYLRLSHLKWRTLDLGLTPNLEHLDLTRCFDLEELHMVGECQKLASLNVSDSRLRSLNLRMVPNLDSLIIDGCKDLVELHMPGRCLNLTSLKLANSKLRILDIGLTPNLEYLYLRYCFNLEELHMTGGYQKLRFLDLGYSNLRTLNLGLVPNLETLILDECNDLVELHMPGGSLNLTSLELTNSKLRTLDLGQTPNLENLDLANSCDLEELHMAAECQKLASINISHSKLRTLDLGLTPNLKKLDVKECNNLVEFQVPIGCLKKLVYLDISGCLRFRYFFFHIKDEIFYSLDESLKVGPSAELHLIGESLEICPVHPENYLPKFEFTCFYKQNLPSLTRNLEQLISFGLCACTNLERFSRSICGLRHLRKLKLEGSIPEAPKDLDQLGCLEELSLSSTKITYLPESICMLKHLKFLVLHRCSSLGKLPEDIGRLECLETLILMECEFLRDIPDSICEMNSLKHFHLRNCIRVEKLPEELGRLQRLNELVIEGTSISHLPQSILLLKGLCIVGSRELLQLFGFTSEIQTLEDLMFCYVEV